MSFFVYLCQNLREYFYPSIAPDVASKSIEIAESTEGSNFETESLIAHNNLRKLHNVPPLKISQELSAKAKDRAMHLASIKKLLRSNDDTYGENLYVTKREESNPLTADQLVKEWYDEILNYDFTTHKSHKSHKSATEHFTQIIWKKTTEIGTACVHNKSSSEFYAVAIYNPPGNIMGQNRKNVLPLSTS